MLSPEERGLIRSSVREIAQLAERLTRTAVQGSLHEDSRAAAHFRSPLNVPSFDGRPIVQETNASILLATAAGSDHVRAFTGALDHRQATVAMGTLVRGAIEAFAKSYYLLSADSTEDFIARHIALTADELKYPLRYSRFREWNGKVTDGSGYPAAHRRIAVELGLPKIALPTEQEKVRVLLSAATTGLEVGGDVYSQLSGAAHAVTSALGMYLVQDGSARFEYPRQIAFEQVGYLFAGVTIVAEHVLLVFGLEEADRERWWSARIRAETALLKIRDAAVADGDH